MPTYDFVCEGCGNFEQKLSFVEAGGPVACPSCGGGAKRVYSMPNTRRMPAGLSKAMDRAEGSAHEPDVVRRPVGGAGSGEGHRHAHGRPWALGH